MTTGQDKPDVMKLIARFRNKLHSAVMYDVSEFPYDATLKKKWDEAEAAQADLVAAVSAPASSSLALTEGQVIAVLRPVVSDIFNRFGGMSRGQALQLLVDAVRSLAPAASERKNCASCGVTDIRFCPLGTPVNCPLAATATPDSAAHKLAMDALTYESGSLTGDERKRLARAYLQLEHELAEAMNRCDEALGHAEEAVRQRDSVSSATACSEWTPAGEAAFEKWWQTWRVANGYPNTERMRGAARAVYASLTSSSLDAAVEQLRSQGHLQESAPVAPASALKKLPCDHCGAELTPAMLPIHTCPERAGVSPTIAPKDLRGEERAKYIHDHDCPKVWAFFNKHSGGSKLCPSCLLCGHAYPNRTDDWAITHAELPDIYICRHCVAAARGVPPTSGRAELAEKLLAYCYAFAADDEGLTIDAAGWNQMRGALEAAAAFLRADARSATPYKERKCWRCGNVMFNDSPFCPASEVGAPCMGSEHPPVPPNHKPVA